MFISEVKIKKTDWHYKILKFVVGEKYIPKLNFCPYFWLTVFSIFMLPIAGTIKLIKFIFDRITYVFDVIILSPLEKIKFEKIITDEDDLYYAILYFSKNGYDRDWETREKLGYYHYFNKIAISTKRMQQLRKIYDLWNKNFKGDHNDFLKKLEIKREKKNKELAEFYENKAKEYEIIENKIKERAKVREDKKRKIINAIVKYTKIFVPFLVGLVIFVVLFCVTKVCIWFYSKISLQGFCIGIGIICLAIVGGILIFYSVIGISKLFDLIFKPKNMEYKPSILNKCIDGIISFFKFFIDFIKAWKSDNCPGIVWEEEN